VAGKRVLVTGAGPIGALVVAALRHAGAVPFRFDHEFDDALSLLASGLDVRPVISHTLPLTRAVEAFDLAGDRAVASKVLLDLGGE
jgi:L-idonate 5-dehydrogenase